MLESNANPKIVSREVQRKISLKILKPRRLAPIQNVQDITIGGGIFHGVIPNVWKFPTLDESSHSKLYTKIAKLSRNMKQMQNEIVQLRGGEERWPQE